MEHSGKYQIVRGEANFSGLFSLEFSNFGLIAKENCDTLLFAKYAELSIAPFQGIFMGSWIGSLIVEDMSLAYAWQELKTIDTPEKEDTVKSQSSALDFNRMLSLIPDNLSVKNTNLSISNSIEKVNYFIPFFEKKNNHFTGEIFCTSLKDKSGFSINTNEQNGDIVIYSLNKEKGNILFPFYDNVLYIGFDTTIIASGNQKEDLLPVLIRAHTLNVFFPRLSSDTIKFIIPELSFNVSINKERFGIEKGSYLANNGVKLFLSCVKTGLESGMLEVDLNLPEVQANKFFQALPQGLFTRSSRFRAEGSFLFYLHLHLNPQLPDSLKFEVSFTGKKVRGLVQDLSRINESFQHTVFEDGRTVASFLVGPENPDFVPYTQINPYLISSVLNSEDGSFFTHRGFYPDAIRESLIENFKAGEFVRGGSTISMQLVKNVFLQKDKTIGRKAEEALLVWLIENYRLVSKERMLEVYFNIIEWGPGIYGIGNASQFYFNKPSTSLTLSECIYLSAIIPSPKKFRYRFDASGHLQPYLAPYYNLLSGKMLRKGQITEQDVSSLIPDVELKGPAKNYLKLTLDSIEKILPEPLPEVNNL